MNKKILVLALLIFSNISANTQEIQKQESSKIKKVLMLSVNALKRGTNIAFSTIKNSAKLVDAALNYTLSPKGAIKVGIMAAPFIYYYSNLYNINPISDSASYLIRLLSKLYKYYEIQVTLGKHDAYVELAQKDGIGALSLITDKMIEKLLK